MVRCRWFIIGKNCFFNERYTATDLFKNPDYCQLAESFGIKGIRCDSYDTLYEKVAFFLNYPGPILCDFKVQSELCYPLVKLKCT